MRDTTVWCVVNHPDLFFLPPPAHSQQESFNGQSTNFSGGGYSYGQGNGVGLTPTLTSTHHPPLFHLTRPCEPNELRRCFSSLDLPAFYSPPGPATTPTPRSLETPLPP